jgi:hypothetical protein
MANHPNRGKKQKATDLIVKVFAVADLPNLKKTLRRWRRDAGPEIGFTLF